MSLSLCMKRSYLWLIIILILLILLGILLFIFFRDKTLFSPGGNVCEKGVRGNQCQNAYCYFAIQNAGAPGGWAISTARCDVKCICPSGHYPTKAAAVAAASNPT